MNEEELREYYKEASKQIINLEEENQQLKGSLQTHEILLRANFEENQNLKEDILFCLKSIKQEMEMSTDSRTRKEMDTCYEILKRWNK